jgi:hypothetical protein
MGMFDDFGEIGYFDDGEEIVIPSERTYDDE